MNILFTFPEYKNISGNVLIDNYGKNDQMKNGENGRGVTFFGAERRNVSEVLQKYQVNTIASDIIPLVFKG
jgi:hypothetical protein